MVGCLAGEVDSPHSRQRAAAEEAAELLTQAALLEKAVKSRLALATDHFNRSPSKGFDYLQVSFWLLALHFVLTKGLTTPYA